MAHIHTINGLQVKTGDMVCTTNGGGDSIAGHFGRLIGMLIPGDVDHTALYVGRGGRCVETGARGCVIAFDIGGSPWDAGCMLAQRGLVDAVLGVAYP